jgi:hypothetical protein
MDHAVTSDPKWRLDQLPRYRGPFPLTSTGVTPNRTWVHAPDEETLVERWQTLISADAPNKGRLLKETDSRKVGTRMPAFPGQPDAAPIVREQCISPRLSRYGFRSFDRQYLVLDKRVVDRLRDDLWRIHNDRQVYLVTQLRHPISEGPAAVFTALVPDVDHYQGNSGGRTIPLFRDVLGTIPNVAPGLKEVLISKLGLDVQNEDLMAYVAAVIAHASGIGSTIGKQTLDSLLKVLI